jgi:hypothetical protein
LVLPVLDRLLPLQLASTQQTAMPANPHCRNVHFREDSPATQVIFAFTLYSRVDQSICVAQMPLQIGDNINGRVHNTVEYVHDWPGRITCLAYASLRDSSA